MSNNKSNNIMSIEKVLNIIEIMSEYGSPMRLQDISEITKIPTTTAYRLINTLKNKGYIMQETSSSRYYLSLKIFNIGNKISENISINNLSIPFLKKLSYDCIHSVNFAVLQDNKATILNVVGGSLESHNITTRIGRSVPLHCTAIGRSLMFDFTDEMIEEYMSNIELMRYTPLTTMNIENLKNKLEFLRNNGYSYDPGEYRAGIVGVSAPILNDSLNPIASISIADLASEITDEKIKFLSENIIKTAKEISKII